MSEYVGKTAAYNLVRRKHVGVGGNWVEIKNGYVGVGGTWRKIYASLTISSNIRNYNVFDMAGNPASPCTVVVKINPGVVVGSNATNAASMSTGAMPAGSTVIIINQGKIVGKGGDGGPGGGGLGSNGLSGGDALSLACTVIIDNTGGIIGAGGGGGAGAATWPGHAAQCGGGGGGQGDSPSSGGAGYAGGTPGTSGNDSAPGIWVPQFHCAGADGGALGTSGGNSGNCDAQPGATGGVSANAIRLNGNSYSFIAVGTIAGAIS